ncbi:MAG TPA: mechanosensitive ion channel [Prolixibacteraceae bacterium]|jgi:small-conductance mechanosensitive channel|nr:mechanosensitive ion channel [Prolixibacteraceae bacterium]HOY50553.1 mechanosensitive ion channel [Prolixibacteraceae bacterium]HPJ77444.1 mechanosensitive ion channel [Prolixibacteraceae bacterium]HRV88050.1 mechanosensitive ion channel [Prolixibacteraceae bacterium]
MESLNPFLEWISEVWNAQLFKVGENPFTTRGLIILLVSLVLLVAISSRISRFLSRRVFPRYGLEPGVSQSMATIIRYVLIIIGLVIIIQTSGINLSALGILMGALGVGIGFGLQNITSNFISGIIILFERPIKVGDRVEIDDLKGNVVEISARATTINTNDNITVIVPNSDFINSRVINWSHNEKRIRLSFPVGVSYNENPEVIRELLTQIALSNPGVLKTPPPYVLFDELGDSSLNFKLLVWTTDYINKPMILKSELYYEIFRRFREKGIEIPYPQRDLHLRTGWDQHGPVSTGSVPAGS